MTAGREIPAERPRDHLARTRPGRAKGCRRIGRGRGRHPRELDDSDNPFWVERRAPTFEARVPVRYVVPPNLPLWLDDHDDTVGRLSVARARGGTVFNVTPEEWGPWYRWLADGLPPG